MSDYIKIALVGIGGYGGTYLNAILTDGQKHNVKLVAGIDPYPEHCSQYDTLKQLGVNIYHDIEDFFAVDSADLVVISTPIHLHASITCRALENGANVLCEKPLAATIQEANLMLQTQKQLEKFVAIGYQWSFSNPIQRLKKAIQSDIFGKPVRLKTLVAWPRDSIYYERNSWAGKIRNSSGDWVLDSPANNATAHYLHNMFYVLGDTVSDSALPEIVTAELYRANPIENYDTATIRCITDKGVEVLFYSTHAVSAQMGPVFCYEFEHAKVYYNAAENAEIIVKFYDGSIHQYGDPQAEPANKLWQCVDAISNGKPIVCDIASSASHTICINAAQESSHINVFDVVDIVKRQDSQGGTLIWVKGLLNGLVQCYDQGIMPAEHGGFPWAKSGTEINVRNYDHFPSFCSAEQIG